MPLFASGGAGAGLHDVAGPADHEADLAGGERAEIFGRVKLAHGRADLRDDFGGLLEVGLLGRVRIEPEIVQRRREDVVGGVEHVDAAVLEPRQILRLEDDVPAVDLRRRARGSASPWRRCSRCPSCPTCSWRRRHCQDRKCQGARSPPARHWRGSAASTCRASGRCWP